jgi:hypothetical protein
MRKNTAARIAERSAQWITHSGNLSDFSAPAAHWPGGVAPSQRGLPAMRAFRCAFAYLPAKRLGHNWHLRRSFSS